MVPCHLIYSTKSLENHKLWGEHGSYGCIVGNSDCYVINSSWNHVFVMRMACMVVIELGDQLYCSLRDWLLVDVFLSDIP